MKSHRNLIIWQRSLELTKKIYSQTRSCPSSEVFGLAMQMRRAAVSVPSNIAEGYARASSKEFLRFLRIANGSLAELETQYLIGLSEGWFSEQGVDEIHQFERILHATIRTVGKKI